MGNRSVDNQFNDSNVQKKLVNGKEVVIKPKQPVNIQKKINQKNVYTSDLAELSSSFNPKHIYDDYIKDMGDAFGKDIFASGSFYQDMDADRIRQRLYVIYRDMWNQIFIQNSLGVIKNEASQTNEEGNKIKIISDDQDIIDVGYELFFDILDMNYEIKNIISETCQMGDCFYEIVLDNYENPTTIIHLEWLDPMKIKKVMENGRLKCYFYYTNEIQQQDVNFNYNGMFNSDRIETKEEVRVFMPWQIVHFRIKDQESEPYGRSLFKSGIKDYRRLTLLEDSMLIYRISRAPERRIFYVDVGQMNTREVMTYLNKIKNIFKKEPIVSESGEISEKANVMSLQEDYYVPRREGQQGTTVQTLQGGIALNEIKDIDYFKDKILRLLNVPMTYIGGGSPEGSSDQTRTLSSQDVKFANYIEEIQQHIVKGLNKIISLQLILKGFKNEEIRNYKVELTSPSNLVQMIQLELREKQIGLASTYKQSGLFSDKWIYKNILRMSIKDMYKEQVELAQQLQKNSQLQQSLGMLGGAGTTGMEGIPATGGMEVPTNIPGGEIPTNAIQGEQIPQQQATPELAGIDYNNMIYKLGMQSILESSGEIMVENIYNILGDSFIIENKQDVLNLITEVKKINKVLEDDETEDEKIKKKKKANDFMSQVLHGEFEGIDGINDSKRVVNYYKNGKKKDSFDGKFEVQKAKRKKK